MLNFDFYGMFDYDAAGGETYEYTSEEFSSLIEGVTGNGISANYLNEFAPTANGFDISVASGAAFIKGRWGYNSTAKTISLSPTTTTQKRIDRIVIELDVASRAIGLNTLVGTATTGTPTAPTLADNQLAICSVLVANGSNTTLTDERVFTYSAADVQKQLNEIKAKIGNLAFLPLSGGTMTGDIDFGNAVNSGIQWTTDNGTRIRIRPYSPANVFQITMKPSNGDEFGAVNIDTSGNITLAQPLPIAYGGTGARDATTARANLGITPANIGAVPLTGGATITGSMTLNDNLWLSNNKSAAGYVKIWADNEGGNIAIGSPNGKSFEIDAYNDTTLRCYAYDDSGNIKGMSFNRTNGNLAIDGDYYRAGQRVADVQHGTATVGTSGTTITFPRAFAGVPSVCANGSKQTSIRVENITSTGCKLISGESNNNVQWIAVY